MDRSLQLHVLFISPMLGLVYTQLCIPNIPVSNGVVTYTGITSGAVAYVICDTGYELNGAENATCIPPIWFPDLGTCDQLEDDCGIPPVVANGNTLFNDTTINSEATVTCNSGYTLNGQPTIQCMASGQWSIGGICDPLKSSPSMGPALTTIMALNSTSERWTMSLGGSHSVTVKTSSLGEESSPTFKTTALKSTTELLTTSLRGSHGVTVETSSVGKESSPISQFNFTATTTALKSTTEQGTMSLSGTHIVTIKTSSIGEESRLLVVYILVPAAIVICIVFVVILIWLRNRRNQYRKEASRRNVTNGATRTQYVDTSLQENATTSFTKSRHETSDDFITSVKPLSNIQRTCHTVTTDLDKSTIEDSYTILKHEVDNENDYKTISPYANENEFRYEESLGKY